MYAWLFRHLPGPLWVRVLAAASVAAAAVFLLMSWTFPWLSQFNPLTQSTLGSATNEGPGSNIQGPGASPAPEPALLPVPSTVPTEVEALRGRLQESLSSLASTSPHPSRQQMIEAFHAADNAAAVEASADLTPTGLQPDAALAAARAGNVCVFGEVRDGQVTVSILPPLSKEGTCFIGSQH